MLIAGARHGGGRRRRASAAAGGGDGGERRSRWGPRRASPSPTAACRRERSKCASSTRTARPSRTTRCVLGMVDKDNKVDVRHGKSDAAGVARFADLPRGDGTGYAAVARVARDAARHGALRRCPTTGGRARRDPGARPHRRPVGDDHRRRAAASSSRCTRTTCSSWRCSRSRTRSDKMFDPGPGAMEIPLPQGFVGAEAQEGERKIEVRQNHGVAVHGAFTPQARDRWEPRAKTRRQRSGVRFRAPLPRRHARVRPADAERDRALHADHRSRSRA